MSDRERENVSMSRSMVVGRVHEPDVEEKRTKTERTK